jgi:hypothetical protein
VGEKGFLVLLKAIWAEPMRWLAILHSKLRHVGDCSDVYVYRFVALCLCRPVFEAHNFLFKLAYALEVRRMARFRFVQSSLGLQKAPLNIDNGLIDGGLGFEGLEALRNVQSSLNCLKSSLDRLNHLRLLTKEQ